MLLNVITSYSIHYTKLYESLVDGICLSRIFFRNPPGDAFGFVLAYDIATVVSRFPVHYDILDIRIGLAENRTDTGLQEVTIVVVWGHDGHYWKSRDPLGSPDGYFVKHSFHSDGFWEDEKWQ